MPPLLALFVRNALIGFGIAVVAVAAILAFDVANLGTLMTKSATGWMAAGFLTFFMGLTFASVQIGIAVMGLGEEPGGDAGDREPVIERRPVPVRAAAPAPRGRV